MHIGAFLNAELDRSPFPFLSTESMDNNAFRNKPDLSILRRAEALSYANILSSWSLCCSVSTGGMAKMACQEHCIVFRIGKQGKYGIIHPWGLIYLTSDADVLLW